MTHISRTHGCKLWLYQALPSEFTTRPTARAVNCLVQRHKARADAPLGHSYSLQKLLFVLLWPFATVQQHSKYILEINVKVTIQYTI